MKTKHLLIICLLALTGNDLMAQLCSNCGKVSYVENLKAIQRINLFSSSTKQKLFTDWIANNASTIPANQELSKVEYTVDQFNSLVKKLDLPNTAFIRIYFANQLNNVESKAYFQPNHELQTSLIFAPVNNTKGDIGTYYTANSSNNDIVLIDNKTTVTSDWIASFAAKANAWKKNSNHPTQSQGSVETTSLLYGSNVLADWSCLINCSQSGIMKVAKIQFNFAAFIPNADIFHSSNGNNIALDYQLTLIVRFLDSNGNIIDFPSYEWFKRNQPKKKFPFTDYDTGVPCPPAENCDPNN